jgi:hypothetical protein
VDETRTLTQLEGDDWGTPPPTATHLVSTAHRLRRVPLVDLEAGDLRLLIGQKISVTTLVPRALRLLRADPMVDSTFYPGDLLTTVLKLPSTYWAAHPAERAELERILDAVDLDAIDELDAGNVRTEIAAFRDSHR